MRTCLRAAFVLVLSLGFAAEPEPRWSVLNRAAREAIRTKDYAKLRQTLEQLRPLMPGNPRVLYNMAAADAVLRNRERALAELKHLASAGLVFDLAADDDFKSLRGAADYQAVVRQMERNRQPVAHSVHLLALEERDMLPEDIAYDAKAGTFLIASVTGAKIVRGDGTLFAKAPWPVMALRIDPNRRILWAASAWTPHCTSCRPEDKDKTALLSYQLESGALIARYDSPGSFTDMTISRAGEIYVSDDSRHAVFRFADGKFERLDVPGEFASPQTPALSADEQTLYVPDYIRGIAEIDLKMREVRYPQTAARVVTSGIDGLYVHGDSFIAVQNGTNPKRVVRISLDYQRQEILEANTPGLGEPTHGTLAGDTFYFIANTGWPEFGANGRKKPGTAPVVSTIRKMDFPD